MLLFQSLLHHLADEPIFHQWKHPTNAEEFQDFVGGHVAEVSPVHKLARLDLPYKSRIQFETSNLRY